MVLHKSRIYAKEIDRSRIHCCRPLVHNPDYAISGDDFDFISVAEGISRLCIIRAGFTAIVANGEPEGCLAAAGSPCLLTGDAACHGASGCGNGAAESPAYIASGHTADYGSQYGTDRGTGR